MKDRGHDGKIVAVCVSERKGVRKKDIGEAFLKVGGELRRMLTVEIGTGRSVFWPWRAWRS